MAESVSHAELVGIDGKPFEFAWIFPGHSSLQILQNIQEDLQRSKIEPEEFGDRIIFISMFNDIDWTGKETKGIVFQSQTRSRRMHKDSRKDIGRSLALERNQRGTETAITSETVNVIPLQRKWSKDSERQVTQS